MLYLTLGFRQFSHYFTDIRDALERGDEDHARSLLAEWRHLDASELPRTELLRHVIEHSLLAAHRHVFGVFFWFVVLSGLGLGPAGAVLYRMAEFASRYWAFKSRTLGVAVNEGLRDLSRQAFGLIDHVPARLTAFGFAVVGNFEEAVAGWRRDAELWKHANEGIILAAAAGAVGVQLGGATAPGVTP
ncbi:MAG: regulatory signaling modulator protein AmpE [Ideonella sp.]|nr:regulatory signaling modulator protein AmpE [Ideonella sp.]